MKLASFERSGVRSYGLIDHVTGTRLALKLPGIEADIDDFGTLRNVVATDIGAT